MILKLTLETENPKRVLEFLDENDYFRRYPLNGEDPAEWMAKNLKYRDIVHEQIPLPGETAVKRSEEDKQWICGVIRDGFYRFTEDRYERGCFTVEVVDSCTEEYGNGKDFYVFTNSYSPKPVLHF